MSAAPAAQAEGATAADQEDSASPLRSQKEAVSIQPTENLCFGGLEAVIFFPWDFKGV